MRAPRLAAATSVLAVAITAVAALHAAASTSASLVAVRVASPLAGPPSSIAALGDSFNTGFDAGTHRGDAPGLSWSPGNNPNVDSLYLRLLDESSAIEGHRYLIARDGSKIGDLARQMAIAADHGAQLITVQSGGNDICSAKDPDHATPPAVFRDEFTKALDVMRRRLPNARLLLTSITDEGRWNDGSASVPGNGKKLSDGTVCDPKLDQEGVQDPSRRSEIQALEQRDNAILRTVCATDPHCRFDRGAFFRLAYSASDISSLDAFHPSISGLNRFSATAWRVGFGYSDRTPPTVSAAASSDGANVHVTLSAHDPVGIAGIEYRTAEGPYAVYTTALELPPGTTLDYRSVDRDGNVSATWSITAPAAG
jgi:lysophospholipase L1-like esterase